MAFNWQNFQEVMSHILHAQPKVDKDCHYVDGEVTRHFDGIRIVPFEPPLSPYRIGIEAKHWKPKKVGIATVEAYRTKQIRCAKFVDNIIIITSKGYTRGAISEAKTSGIQLLEFHKSTKEDLEDRIGRIVINLTIKQPPEIRVKHHLVVVSQDLSEEEKKQLVAMPMKSGRDESFYLYDKDGIFIEPYQQFIDRKVKGETWNSLIRKHRIRLSLSDSELYFKRRWKGGIANLKLERLDIEVVPREPTVQTVEVGGTLESKDWYKMTNTLTGDFELINVSLVNQMIDKYGLT